MKKIKYFALTALAVSVLLISCQMGLTDSTELDTEEIEKENTDLTTESSELNYNFFSPSSEQEIKENSNYGYVIVKIDSDFNESMIKEYNAEISGRMEMGDNSYLYVKKNNNILGLLKNLNNTPGIIYAEADVANKLYDSIEYQRDLNDPRINSSQYSYHITQLGEALKKYGVGDKEIYIATVDSGINKPHEEFSDIFSESHPGYSMFSKSGNEGAVNYRFIGAGSSPVPMDSSNWDSNPGEGHGTHVSGTILAKGNNGLGVTGICPDNAKYLFYKCFADDANGNSVDGSGSTWAVYGSLKHLIDWKASNLPEDYTIPVNMSLGGDWASNFAIDAINFGLTKKVVVIAASGNDGFNISSFPAAYQGVIAVGATNGRDEKVHFSNSGKHLSVTAPGFNIISTGNVNDTESNKYNYKSGTSMAAPFVTGLVGLMLTHDPTLSPAMIKQLLEDNADDKGSFGFDEDYGWGRVNVAKTIKSVIQNKTRPVLSRYSDYLLKAKVLNGSDGAVSVPVYLYKDSGAFVAAALTSENGEASFGLLEEGNYIVKVFYYNKPLENGTDPIINVSFKNQNEDKIVELKYDFPILNIITASNDGTKEQIDNGLMGTDTIITVYLAEGDTYTQLTTYDSGALDKINFPLDHGKDYIIGINAYVYNGTALGGHYAVRISNDDPEPSAYTGKAVIVDANDTLGEPDNNFKETAYEITVGTTYNAYLNETETDFYKISME